MAVVWFRLRAVGRQRWRAWLALALLVGLGGGIVLGALAGARRTDSAYGRFLKEVNAFDVALAGEDLEAVRRLPQVADVAGNDVLLMALLVGAPLGLAGGRWTWRLFADSLGVVPAPIMPLAVALGMVPAAIFVANVIAAIPGRMASRVQPAFALQAE